MNAAQRFRVTEEDLSRQQEEQEEEQKNAPPPLPILNRTAAVDDDVSSTKQKSPVVVIVVGMAGSGKTTLMAQLQRSLVPPDEEDEKDEKEEEKEDEEKSSGTKTNDDQRTSEPPSAEPSPTNGENNDEPSARTKEEVEAKQREGEGRGRVGYCVNLDPATKLVPFGASIDIRDTVDYKEVMLQHQLGPNGAIMTCLNLFATKFDQVMSILEARSFPSSSSSNEPPLLDRILVDTPGQIEAFTWSASGSIMTSALASSFPTVLAFVVDTPRCAASPTTFMSNMLYACSIMYRTRLPVVVVFNKIDVVPHEFCEEWMTDYDAFQEALDEFQRNGGNVGSGYYGSLTRSLSLALDEFYSTLLRVGVSAATGEGVEAFWDAIASAARDFETGYVEDLKGRIEEQEVKKRVVQRESMRRLKRDMKRDNAKMKKVSGRSGGGGAT